MQLNLRIINKKYLNANHILMQTNKKLKNNQNFLRILTGSVAGIANGLFGGGGGMIVVPMLNFLLKYENKQSHATALLIILPLSIVSGLFYAIFGNFNVNSGVPTAVGVVIGGIIGALLLKKLSSRAIVIIFSVAMAIAGIKMLVF